MPEHSLTIINRISLSFFLVIIVDYLFFRGQLRALLPNTVTSFGWYYFIFGLPHIIASYVGYCNKEYFEHYKKKLLTHMVSNLFLLLFFLIFLPSLFIYFFIAYTMYHVAWQQLGLCRRYIGKEKLYALWSTCGLTGAVFLALSVGGEAQVHISSSFFTVLQLLGISSVFIFFITGLLIFKRNEYVLTTILIITLASIAILMGYPIIGIIMMRFTHDATAFTIYAKHDEKYQKKYEGNFLYSFFKITPSWIISFLLIFSITISFFLQVSNNSILYLIIILVSLMHYSLEGVIWRRGTLHRKTLD